MARRRAATTAGGAGIGRGVVIDLAGGRGVDTFSDEDRPRRWEVAPGGRATVDDVGARSRWAAPPPSEDGRILIVDADDAGAQRLTGMLGVSGFADVARCSDRGEALDRYRRDGADLIIVDLHLPGDDGDELIRRIAEAVPDDGYVPVMVITADASDEARDRAFEAGAADFLVKPFDLHECALRVRNLLHIRHVNVMQAREASRLAERIRRRDAIDEQAASLASAIHARVDRVLAAGGPTMVFQPITSIADGRPAGFEALARFEGGEDRAPDVWFAEAASVGRGIELELAAIERALDRLGTLAPGTFLAVNASSGTMVDPRLLELVRATDGSRVVVELTEHEQVADYEVLLATIVELRATGARIAMDDAGTGFAGLQQILRLDPDVIKLDRFLIEGIDTDAVRQALVTALVSFSTAIGATLLGEGIETDGELAVLRTLGVPLGQGFLLGRPGPIPGPLG